MMRPSGLTRRAPLVSPASSWHGSIPCVCAPSTRQEHRRGASVRASASPSSSQEYKRAAAKLFVDTFVKDGQVLGLGTGELCSLVVEEVARRCILKQLTGVQGVPTSDAAATEAAFQGLPLHPEASAQTHVDLAFDQADQVDVQASACLLGVPGEPQQPQLLRALVMAQQKASKFVVLVDGQNVVERLHGTLPVLIDAETWEETAEEVDDVVIGDAEVWRRAVPGSTNINPRGGDTPYVTEEGHNILDLRYEGKFRLFGEITPYSELEDAIMDVEGVIATGMLLRTACAAVVAAPPTSAGGGPKVIELQVDPAHAALASQQQE